MKALIQTARSASPYLAIEILLPGGSVIALLLWLFRNRVNKDLIWSRANTTRQALRRWAFSR